MARLAFLAVLIVALGSVAFSLDWLSAPMSPMPDSGRAPQAVVAPARPVQPQTVGAQPPREAAAAMPTTATPIKCNVSACASAYRSFQASDCSYQPNSGPRRRCAKK